MGDRSYKRDDDRRYHGGRDDDRRYREDRRDQGDRDQDRARHDNRSGRDQYGDRYGGGGRGYDRDDRGRNRSPGQDNERYDEHTSKNKVGGGGEKARDETNTNARIYITGLPPDITENELADHFGALGRVAKKKQKRGYPDQWPYKISIYTDASGKCKGDAALTYEDFNAAQCAPDFFNNSTLKGATIQVSLAQEKGAGEIESGGGFAGGRGGHDAGRGRQERFGGRDFRGGRDNDRDRGGDRSRGGYRDGFRDDRRREGHRY